MTKRIGFLSFGHWAPVAGSRTPTAADALNQTIELAVAAEALGIDGAYVRVHHFARQLASPFPLLAAIGARTSTIEIGTAVIDMRYENPLYMAEDAAAADLISGGRLQLGISRGSPEPALNGARRSATSRRGRHRRRPRTREHRALPRGIAGEGSPSRSGDHGRGRPPTDPAALAGTDRAHLVGRGTRETARWTAEQGMQPP